MRSEELEHLIRQLSEYQQSHFFGKYCAIVADNADPEQLGRLKLRVPGVTGDTISGWAVPCLPIGTLGDPGALLLPEVGTQVWVEFEAGDIDRPVWVGLMWQGDAETAPAAGIDQPKQIAEAEAAITKGLLTYDAEGMEGGRYHSRVLHVPGATSGLTIGRGYDMKEKTAQKIKADLIDAGLDVADAERLRCAAGKCGPEAEHFISDHGMDEFEISMQQQERLFRLIYDELEQDVIRICNKADCVKKYGAVNWQALDPKIRDVLVDLRFRGDYTPASRRKIQKHVANNDLTAFTQQLINRNNWSQVPPDRFRRRVAYLTG